MRLARVRRRRELRFPRRQAEYDRLVGEFGEWGEMGHAGTCKSEGGFDGRPDEDGAHIPGRVGASHEDGDVVDPNDASKASAVSH